MVRNQIYGTGKRTHSNFHCAPQPNLAFDRDADTGHHLATAMRAPVNLGVRPLMNSKLARSLLFIVWSTAAAGTITVAINAFLAWSAPTHLHLAILGGFFTAGFFPFLLLTYIACSDRFGIGWHWLIAIIASLLALEVGRIALSGTLSEMPFKSAVHSSCSIPTEATLDQHQRMAISCATASWLLLTSSVFVQIVPGGLLLAVAAWAYKHLVHREDVDNQ